MKNVLYITYVDVTSGNASSGSSIRPRRIYECFLEREYNVIMLEGAQLRDRKEERLERINQISKILDEKNFDYCYIELPTTPITFQEDINLIKKIKRKEIKIGIFYRDFYWKYPDVWQAKGVKKFYYILKYKKELRVFKKCANVIFFPTEQAIQNFKLFEKMDGVCTSILPPGMEIVKHIHEKIYNNLIYVGGLSNLYKIELFLEALKRINERQLHVGLTLVCRPAELQKRKFVIDPYINYPWLNIVHTSDQRCLKELYEKADMGISSLDKNGYADMSMPIKIGEYLSNGLPIIATASKEIEKMIKTYQCGIVCAHDAENIMNKIEEIYSDDDILKKMQSNTYKTTELNSWNKRIDKLEKALGVLE